MAMQLLLLEEEEGAAGRKKERAAGVGCYSGRRKAMRSCHGCEWWGRHLSRCSRCSALSG
jgi:hypothetical protein